VLKTKVKLGRLELKNPIMPASGTFGLECVPFVNPSLLGAVVTRSVTLHAQSGPPSPRMVEVPSGLLSAVEVQSEGADAFALKELPRWREYLVPLIVNVAGKTIEEYCEVVARLGKEKGIAAFELNLSHFYGGLEASFIDAPAQLVNRVKQVSPVPVIAKLFPFFAVEALARRCEEAGADIISLTHGFPGVALDPRTGKSRLGSPSGLLTGPAIKPMAVELLTRIRQAVRLPLIGMGGIFSAADVREFMQAGASAVAVGTATLVNPRAIAEIIERL
jgi:dihydroorotate dehydrogenase (NAD+) catalytic subunit